MKNALSPLLAVLAAFALVGAWSLLPPQDVFISDLEVEVVSWYWAEPQRDASTDGNSLMIGERWFARGYGVHAATELKVPVPSTAKAFITYIGIDDEVGEEVPSSVQFIIIGDGATLYESPMMVATDPPRRVYLNVEGIAELRLIATDGGDSPNHDHADWANARFLSD
ncbi:MAG: NPCBM/NEW2 domain-containing protein [Candidatus Hinthialibacter antarcticus]|nr:NPCBM/NEW2 domain-containing protein [Candidatus Hinthialibacter antarcticus]